MSGPFGSSQWMYATGSAVEGQSLRFNDDDSAYLSWTPASAGNRKTWTWSGWVKRGNLPSSDVYLFGNSNGSNQGFHVRFDSGDTLTFLNYPSSASGQLTTSRVFRDTSAWYHIVLVWDTTDATSGDRMRMYINGERETAFGTASYPSLNLDGTWNSTSYGDHAIGRNNYNGRYFDGYMAEVNFVDGAALDPTSFGETDANGQWVPITNPSVTYGTNGFYLPFSNGIGNDESGNSNDFTANNLATTDIVLDSPTNNFSTFNPTDPHGGNAATLSEGNLKASSEGSNSWSRSTYWIESGAYYCEILSQSSGGQHAIQGNYGDSYFSWTDNGQMVINGSSVGSYSSHTSGDIIGLAIDRDANTVKFYKNNTLVYTGTSLSSGAIKVGSFFAPSSGSAIGNFGQDSSFAGNKVAQGNVDENGFGDFYYEPPAGYLALCTQNLPDPAINDGTEHFNTVLYTGNGSTQSITGVGFQPDFTWIKVRSATNSHYLFDQIRGADQALFSDSNSAETDYSSTGRMTSFDTDGFTVKYSSSTGTNASSNTYAAWNWLAGGTGVANTDGSISTTVSANTTAGFSIVKYNGNDTAGDTIGHGLSAAPEFILIKRLTTGGTSLSNWTVYHQGTSSTPQNDYMFFNTTAAKGSSITVWNNTAPTSSVITLSTSDNVNYSTDDYIAYCFHSVEGYSKFGSYEGNGSSDGTFVYTGFRPAFVITKETSGTGSWYMFDNKRNGYNETEPYVISNASNVEATDLGWDILSNGFKLRNSYSETNGSGDTYIYMAFAENPFKYSNAR